jgi:hypothetical protein
VPDGVVDAAIASVLLDTLTPHALEVALTVQAELDTRVAEADALPLQAVDRRGHTGDPLYGIRRIARTRLQLLSLRQYARLSTVFAADEHLAVKLA